MKLAWGTFLGLLLLFQIIGWQLFGRAQPIAAVAVMAIFSAWLIGVFSVYFYQRDIGALALLPLFLLVVGGQLIYAPRHDPRNALITHALSHFLGYEVTPIESYIGGGILLLLMCLATVIFAFLTAEMAGRLTGNPHISGVGLMRGAWHDFLRWEKHNVKTKQEK